MMTSSEIHEVVRNGTLQELEIALALDHSLIDVEDKFGRLPIHYAAALNKQAMLTYLITKDSHTNARDYKDETPLSLAHKYGHTECIRILTDLSTVSEGNLHIETDLSSPDYQRDDTDRYYDERMVYGETDADHGTGDGDRYYNDVYEETRPQGRPHYDDDDDSIVDFVYDPSQQYSAEGAVEYTGSVSEMYSLRGSAKGSSGNTIRADKDGRIPGGRVCQYTRSKRWDEERQKRLERDRTRLQREEMKKCSFKPKVAASSSLLRSRSEYHSAVPLPDRQVAWVQEREQRLEIERQKRLAEEMADCSFTPLIGRAAVAALAPPSTASTSDRPPSPPPSPPPPLPPAPPVPAARVLRAPTTSAISIDAIIGRTQGGSALASAVNTAAGGGGSGGGGRVPIPISVRHAPIAVPVSDRSAHRATDDSIRGPVSTAGRIPLPVKHNSGGDSKNTSMAQPARSAPVPSVTTEQAAPTRDSGTNQNIRRSGSGKVVHFSDEPSLPPPPPSQSQSHPQQRNERFRGQHAQQPTGERRRQEQQIRKPQTYVDDGDRDEDGDDPLDSYTSATPGDYNAYANDDSAAAHGDTQSTGYSSTQPRPGKIALHVPVDTLWEEPLPRSQIQALVPAQPQSQYGYEEDIYSYPTPSTGGTATATATSTASHAAQSSFSLYDLAGPADYYGE